MASNHATGSTCHQARRKVAYFVVEICLQLPLLPGTLQGSKKRLYFWYFQLNLLLQNNVSDIPGRYWDGIA